MNACLIWVVSCPMKEKVVTATRANVAQCRRTKTKKLRCINWQISSTQQWLALTCWSQTRRACARVSARRGCADEQLGLPKSRLNHSVFGEMYE